MGLVEENEVVVLVAKQRAIIDAGLGWVATL